MTIYQEASVFDNEQMSEDINDASTKAKSYMSFKSGYGLMIANLTNGEVAPDEVTTGTRNVLISPTEVMIRNGKNNLARFGSSVYLDEDGGGVYVGKIESGYYNTRILYDGMKVYSYNTQIANFGSSIWLGNATNFSVDLNGKLTANSATINGVLTAGAGSSIGGWTAYSTRLEADHTGENGYRAGIQNLSGSNPTSAVFFAGCNTSSSGTIEGMQYSNFYVTQQGYLYCRKGVFGDNVSNESRFMEIDDAGFNMYYRTSGGVAKKIAEFSEYISGSSYGLTMNLGGFECYGEPGSAIANGRINAIGALNTQSSLLINNEKPIAVRIVRITGRTINANSYGDFSLYLNTPTDYTPLGVIVIYTNHRNACKITSFYTDVANDFVYVSVSNTSSTNITDLSITIRAIYMKSGIITVLPETVG